jgi:hypothetical protein
VGFLFRHSRASAENITLMDEGRMANKRTFNLKKTKKNLFAQKKKLIT